MKKIGAFLVAIILVFITMFFADRYLKNKIVSDKNKLIYSNIASRNNLDYLMDEIITDKSILVLGSSELSSRDTIAFPNYLYNNGNSNYYYVPVGRGNNQSLFHAISLGALSNNIKNNKVVLIVSPQWFANPNTTAEMFSSRFSERMYVEFLKNDIISKDVKKRIASRVEPLLSEDETQQKRVEDMNSIYLSNDINILKRLKYLAYNSFIDLKETYTFYKNMEEYYSIPRLDKQVDAEIIDYEKLLIDAETAGEKECTNNEFGIYDDYYNQYIKDVYEEKKDSQKKSSYLISQEYDDLRLFLDVSKDLNLDVLLISVPVNGRWYDYTGFPKTDREQYYENIRQISKEYNVKLADFSDKEYELYFLRDIMHLGWKGWVYVDEAIYKFYKDEF